MEQEQETALRFNENKPELSYVLDMRKGMEMLATVMQQGAIKYERGNWLKGGKPDQEYMDSAMRHMVAFQAGEEYDPDTGCHHIAHAAWNMLALLTVNRKDMDDLNESFDRDAFVKRYGPDNTPVFQPGDRVQDEYNDRGTVHTVRDDGYLRVQWDTIGLSAVACFHPPTAFKHE